MVKLSISILGCQDIKKALCQLNKSTCNYLHLDVMNNTLTNYSSYEDLEDIKKYNEKELDVHLMVSNPSKIIDKYLSLSPTFITIHQEINEDIKYLIEYIKKYNVKVGISLQIKSDISLINEYLDCVDLILVMAVKIGKSGQLFDDRCIEKVKQLACLREEYGYSYVIEVDGGINDKSCKLVKEADILVSGSYVMNSDDIDLKISELSHE